MIIVPIYRSRGPYIPAHCCPKCGHRFDEPLASWKLRLGVAYLIVGFIVSGIVGYLLTMQDHYGAGDGAIFGPMFFFLANMIGGGLLRGLYYAITGK